jgi:hypothetical protein
MPFMQYLPKTQVGLQQVPRTGQHLHFAKNLQLHDLNSWLAVTHKIQDFFRVPLLNQTRVLCSGNVLVDRLYQLRSRLPILQAKITAPVLWTEGRRAHSTRFGCQCRTE